MNYYWFNRQEILQKAKENYSKEKAAEYYKQSKEAIKEKSRERYKSWSQEQKDEIKEYQKKIKKYQELVQYKREALNNNFCFFLNIKISEKTLKFNNIIVNKKKFHRPKEPIDLLSVDLDQIVVSHKFEHNDKDFKYFIGYLQAEIVKIF